MANKVFKLLLIAMSGVRVKDQELLELGMTLPGFVERSKVIASLPSLSLLTIAAHTPANWEVTYKEIDEFSDDAVERILGSEFDLIGISAFTARIFDAYTLANQLRAAGQVVVLGGIHVSVMPEEALQHANTVVVGEGELVWPDVISDFEASALKPLYSSFNSKKKFLLRDSKIPRYDLLDIDRYNRITLQTTRGCPLDCAFCAASRVISTYKTKPIDLVRSEIEAILKLWPRPFLELADDNTFYNKRWGKELAKLFCEYDLRWFTETDISIADDEKLLELLAKSGCSQVLVGLESSAPQSLKGIDAHDWKLRQYDFYYSKIEKIQSYGISVNGCFVIGFDNDDTSIFESTAEFVSTSGLSEVQVTLLTPFPGTELYRQLKRDGRLLQEVFWDQCTLFDLTFLPKRMSVDELSSGFKWLMRTLYTEEEYSKRKQRFKACAKVARDFRQQ